MPPKRIPDHPLGQESAKRFRLKPATSSSQQVNRVGDGDLERYPDVVKDAISESELCSNCMKLDLEAMFGKETNSMDIGFLERYNSPVCPFCAIIWRSIQIHWGSKNPLTDTSVRPKLFVQSKKWCSFRHGSGRHSNYRMLLAITQQPPGFKLKRRVLRTDKQNRFVLTELELLAKTASDDSKTLSLRRTIGSHLDLSLLHRWLENCKSHDRCNSRHSDEEIFLGGFRLIDVFEARLVEKTERCEYFALSYVWGYIDPLGLRTTKRNLSRLRQPSALRQSARMVGRRIPRTIADAMELCRVVGQRYLWVDCLCIVQDDLNEKMRLIHGMGRVYENASLTIFAISGRHADAGLAGIVAREDIWHEKRHVIKTQDNMLTVSIAPISLEEQIRSSYWSTRGWTFQEQALSERRLYFTSNEVFFECSSCKRREGYRDEEFESCIMRTGPPWWGRNIKTYLGDPLVSVPLRDQARDSLAIEKFSTAVSEYTRRNLTYPEDVLNAFTGIYDRFTSKEVSNLEIVAVQGTPFSIFSQSLLWFIPKHGSKNFRRRNEIHGTKLASWSWASWIAPIDFVCLTYSSFPAPSLLDFHSDEEYCFVSEWYLSFHDGVGIRRAEFPGGRYTVSRFDKEYSFKPDELLSILGSKPQPYVGDAVAGTLEFIAPCITFSSGFQRISDATLSKGEWKLSFPGIERCFCFVQFDSDDEYISELIVILYDGTYVALCVKTLDGISRRVGVAVLLRSRRIWNSILSRGLLDIQWRHVRLC